MEKTKALQLLAVIKPNIKHADDCSSRESFSNPASDYCDCGLGQAKEAFNQLLQLLNED